MGKDVQAFSSLWVPDPPVFVVSMGALQLCIQTDAVKSAEPVAAILASEDNLDDQTAPLCPMKVPILGCR